MTIGVRIGSGRQVLAGDVSSLWDRLMAADPEHPAVVGRGFAEFTESVFPTEGEDVTVVAEQDGHPIGLWPLRIIVNSRSPLSPGVLTHRCARRTYYGDGVFLPDTPVDQVYRMALRKLDDEKIGDAVDIWRLLRKPELVATQGTSAVPANVVHLDAPLPRHSDRKLRRLERLPGFRAETVSDRNGLMDAATEFAALHTRLKHFQNQFAYFEMSPGASERFPTALAKLATETPVSLLTFRAGNRLIAAQVLLHHGNNTTLWWVAWEPELAGLSPGIAILDYSVRLSCERGDSTFHLGPGGESYKLRWASTQDTVGRIRQYRTTPRGLMARVGDRSRRWFAATRGRFSR